MTEMEAEMAALRKDLKSLRADMRGLLEAAGSDGAGRLEAMKTRIWSATKDLETRAQDMARQAYVAARDYGEEVVDKGREEVRKRPLTYVMGGLAIGFLAGWLMRRR